MSLASSIVLLAILAVCHPLAPSSFLSTTDKHRLQKIFESVVPYTDVKNLHYSVKGLKVLNAAIPKEACSFLQSKANIALDLESLYHVTSGAEYLGNCALTALNGGDLQKKLDETLVDGAKIEDVFYALVTLKNMKLTVPAAKIKKIVDSVIKKDSSVSVESYAFHIVSQLGLEKKDLAVYVDDISDVVKQADEYNDVHLFYDSGLFTTAFVIEGIFSLSQSAGVPPKGLDANSLIKFTNYLLSRRHTYQLKSAAHLINALYVIAKNSFITPVCIQLLDLTARGVSESQPLIQVRLVNAWGEAFSKDYIQQLTASSVISASGTNDSVTILSMEVFKLESEGVYSLDLFSRVKQRPSKGMYKVQLTVAESSNTAAKPKLAGLTSQFVDIKVTGEIVVEGVELSVRDPLDQKAATAKSALLKFMSKASNQLDLDHQQKLVVRFTAKDKIPGPGPKEGSPNSGVISQAFIRLYHIESQVEYIVNVASTPPAPFANSADIVEYRLLFDPTVHLPKNYQAGLYQLDLILGDAFISNPVQWIMADLLLQTSGVDAGKKDVDDKHAKADMDHMFREPDKRAPFTIAATFTILCALPFLIMLILWIKIGVNISCPCGINALGFHGGCLAIFVLYALYWIKLDMFQTLKYLTIISLFTMFFGLKLLQSVAAKRQKS